MVPIPTSFPDTKKIKLVHEKVTMEASLTKCYKQRTEDWCGLGVFQGPGKLAITLAVSTGFSNGYLTAILGNISRIRLCTGRCRHFRQENTMFRGGR